MNNKKCRRGVTGGLHNERRTKTGVTRDFTTDHQKFQLSPDSLTRIGFLAGDLGCYYLRKLPTDKYSPRFLPLFDKANLCLKIEDDLLLKAAQALARGES